MRRHTSLSVSSLQLVVVLLACLLLTTQALPYFRIEDGGKQCFIEEGQLSLHVLTLFVIISVLSSQLKADLSALLYCGGCAVPEDTLIVGKYKLLDWTLMNTLVPGRQTNKHTQHTHLA